jgi:hypothetical protein
MRKPTRARYGRAMLSFPLCPLLAASATVTLTRFGFHAVSLSNSDVLELNLDDRFAVFLDVLPNAFSGQHQTSESATPTFFSISIPDFTSHSGILRIQPLVQRGTLQMWLLSHMVCPDPTNIAIASTDHLLHFESDITGTACIFFHPGADFYSVQLSTLRGFPWVSFFTRRGRGDAVKLCQGESDLCELRSPDLLFLSLRGPARFNFSYAGGRFSKAFPCSVQGLPLLRNGSFVDVGKKIKEITLPWCSNETNGLEASTRVLREWAMIVVAVAVVGIMFVRKGSEICIRFANRGCADRIRRIDESW